MPVVLTSLQPLVEQLRTDGYRVVGPTLRQGAIVLAELESASELPYGTGVRLAPGEYRPEPRPDGAAFAHVATPQSWKSYLYPARTLLWSGERGDGAGFTVDEPDQDTPRFALLGVRPCDLRAIAVQGRVFAGRRAGGPDPGTGTATATAAVAAPDGVGNGGRYAARRAAAFLVAVNCTVPGETCFCASMGTGPRVADGYDLVLTEVTGDGGVRYVAEAGSPAGSALLDRLPHQAAGEDLVRRAGDAVDAAVEMMGRRMPAVDLPTMLAASREAARWDDVARRCLACGNCTMACPTCFCSTVSDVTDLSGDHAERWLSWDSCFSLDFSYIHGGSVRPSVRSRYRQWLTHKLGTWYDQFGESGCVGCGRCIVWCPVGIDITEEANALAAERVSAAGKAAALAAPAGRAGAVPPGAAAGTGVAEPGGQDAGTTARTGVPADRKENR